MAREREIETGQTCDRAVVLPLRKCIVLIEEPALQSL